MPGLGLSRASVAAALLALLPLGQAGAGHVGQDYCDTGIPADETLGFTGFPRGDVFCPLLADPKGDGSFASYVRSTSASTLGTDLASVGIGDHLGLLRWNGPRLGEGLQLALGASVYAQFDLNAPSFDLINADYVIGLPLTYRRGKFSSRLRLYHQSSHLGDEFLLRATVQRENFSFESLEYLASLEAGPFRPYAGGELLFNRRPEALVSRVVHGGAELRQPIRTGRGAPVRVLAGVDVKTADELGWQVSWSARAGLELGRTHRIRTWRVLAEYYDGHSPYGQFVHERVEYYGFGLHVGI